MTDREKFKNIMDDDSYGMCPAPTKDELAVNVLIEYLLGKDWYVSEPLGVGQVNTVAVHEILMKYSAEYRKERKRDARRRAKLQNDKTRKKLVELIMQ